MEVGANQTLPFHHNCDETGKIQGSSYYEIQQSCYFRGCQGTVIGTVNVDRLLASGAKFLS